MPAEPPLPPPRAPSAPVVLQDAPEEDVPAPTWRVVAAFSIDEAFASDEPVVARRLVYRVALRVPHVLGDAPPTVAPLSAELYVDVSADRLVARFAGPGWPVPNGAEVRLRREEGGAYIFDEEGGRPLGPGQMAAWFQGGRVRRTPMVRVRAPTPDEQSGPGALLCRLLSEWSQQPPDAVERRCGDGGSVPAFRVGPWQAERTADVAVTVPRSALRADHLHPPQPLHRAGPKPLLSDGALARLRPRVRRPLRADAEGGLRVANRGRAHAVITVGGVPVVWLAPGEEADLGTLAPGIHRVGAMRPLGLPALTSRSTPVPGELILPR